MRSSISLAAIDQPDETAPERVDQAVRKLLEVIDRVSANDSKAPRISGSPSQEVLVDTELAGFRYLLVRMPQPNSNRIRLSPREQEIVRMVAKGHPNKVIADVLNISSWTVCTHLRRIFAKLGVGSRAAMVAQLLDIGALSPEHCMPSDLRRSRAQEALL